MSDSIDHLYEAGQGTLQIRLLEQCSGGEFRVNFSGNRFVFEFLAEAISDLLESDCKYHLAPFGAGCGWFGRHAEKDAAGWYLAGSTVLNSGGLYLHLQPCVSDIVFFPGGRGLGWMCFPNEFEGVDEKGRDYDPAYLVIEGQGEELNSIRKLFLQAASGYPVIADQASVQAIFGNTASIGIEIAPSSPI